jgi:hypothetical protein
VGARLLAYIEKEQEVRHTFYVVVMFVVIAAAGGYAGYHKGKWDEPIRAKVELRVQDHRRSEIVRGI